MGSLKGPWGSRGGQLAGLASWLANVWLASRPTGESVDCQTDIWSVGKPTSGSLVIGQPLANHGQPWPSMTGRRLASGLQKAG